MVYKYLFTFMNVAMNMTVTGYHKMRLHLRRFINNNPDLEFNQDEDKMLARFNYYLRERGYWPYFKPWVVKRIAREMIELRFIIKPQIEDIAARSGRNITDIALSFGMKPKTAENWLYYEYHNEKYRSFIIGFNFAESLRTA